LSGNRTNAVIMLFALVGIVPLLAGGAGLAAFLLQRVGFGLAVWGLLPFLGLCVAALALGAALGKAAGGRRGGGASGKE
jgi:hypothetical protein